MDHIESTVGSDKMAETIDGETSITSRELETRLLELQELFLTLSVQPAPPVATATTTKNIFAFSDPNPHGAAAVILDARELHLLRNISSDVNQLLLSTTGNWFDQNEVSTISLSTTSLGSISLSDQERTNDECTPCRFTLPNMWDIDDTAELQEYYSGRDAALSPASVSSSTSVNSFWKSNKRQLLRLGRCTSQLATSLLLKRHFRHELLTATHDTIAQLLQLDSGSMLRAVQILRQNSNSVSNNEDSTKRNYGQFEIDNSSNSNFLQSFFTGISSVAIQYSAKPQTQHRLSRPHSIASGCLVQEVNTQLLFHIPTLEATYSVYYCVLHLLPMLQSSCALHHLHCADQTSDEKQTQHECILCMLHQWSQSFDSQALWDVYQHRLRANSFSAKANARALVDERSVQVVFVTSLSDRGEVLAVCDDKLDITHYLEVVRDLMTLTACLLMTQGDLLVFDGRYPFDTIATSFRNNALGTSASLSSLSASTSPSFLWASDEFVCLPLRLHLHPTQARASTVAMQTALDNLLVQHRGVLHLQLVSIAAVRLQQASVVHFCMTTVEELLFGENCLVSSHLSTECQQILQYLVRPPMHQQQAKHWFEIFSQHLLPTLDIVGLYGCLASDWQLPLAFWLLRQLLQQQIVPTSTKQDVHEEAMDVSMATAEMERDYISFVHELLTLPSLQEIATPFALQCFLFPSSSTTIDTVLQEAEMLIQQLAAHSQSLFRQQRQQEQREQQQQVEEDSEDSSESSSHKSNHSHMQLLTQWETTMRPRISRYHHFLTHYVRLLTHDEDNMLAREDSQDAEFVRRKATESENVVTHLLHLSLLLSRCDSLMLTSQSMAGSRGNAQGRVTGKKNKYLVSVRSLLRKVSNLTFAAGNCVGVSIYHIDPLIALQLCLRFAFLDGVYSILDMIRLQNNGKSITGATTMAILQDCQSLLIEEQRANLANAISSWMKQRHRRIGIMNDNESIAHKAIAEMRAATCRFVHYANYLLTTTEADASMIFSWLDLLGSALNQLTCLGNDTFADASHLTWETVGTNATVSQHIAEWGVFVLLQQLKLTEKQLGNFQFAQFLGKFDCLMEWMSVEYVLYLQDSGYRL
jgi:hypothetical protein